jgi:hypothetical protein
MRSRRYGLNLAAVVPRPEHRVTCLPPLTFSGGDERLIFEIDGVRKGVSLKIRQHSRRLVESLPDRALDLIEIAALVYTVDAAISRGGLTDQQMGAKWHRRFVVEMPVFDFDIWTTPKVKNALEETLMFLSGDRFEFVFSKRDSGPAEQPKFFNYGPDSAWSPDTVMMFSGGLDSFAGALEEIIEKKNKVSLISHFSSSKIAPVQRLLEKAMTVKLGPQKLMYFPMRVQLQRGTNSEGTHRTRSFIFAALGVVTAITFGNDKVSFYENGVVSLNLPPVGNVLGTRATRKTHPQTLFRFTDLFSRIFAKPLRIDNPFFWRTKTDVINDRVAIANGRNGKDVGIDLVAKLRNEDGFAAIKAKFYAADTRIQKSHTDSFISASGKEPFRSRVVLDTTEQAWSSNAEEMILGQVVPVVRIGLTDLRESRMVAIICKSRKPSNGRVWFGFRQQSSYFWLISISI